MLFFGAAKLPKLGNGLGEGIRNFKKGLKSDKNADNQDDKKLEAAENEEAEEK
jgi:sec-independent protein translocase protein TatA